MILEGKLKPVLSKSEHFDWFFLGRDFAVRTVPVEMVQAIDVFLFRSKADKFKIYYQNYQKPVSAI